MNEPNCYEPLTGEMKQSPLLTMSMGDGPNWRRLYVKYSDYRALQRLYNDMEASYKNEIKNMIEDRKK